MSRRVTRQSTLVAGLREEDFEGQDMGMALRPHHRTDPKYSGGKNKASPKKLTVKWLRAKLKAMGLETTGLKAVLKERYESAVSGSGSEEEEEEEEDGAATPPAFTITEVETVASPPKLLIADPIFRVVVVLAIAAFAVSLASLAHGDGLTERVLGKPASEWIFKDAVGWEPKEMAVSPDGDAGNELPQELMEDYSFSAFWTMLKLQLQSEQPDGLTARRYFLRVTGHNFHVVLGALVLYLLVICYALPMKLAGQRQKVRGIFALWNALLAAFAIWGALNTVPHFFNVMVPELGWDGVICVASSDTPLSKNSKYGVAIPLFIVSKIPELFDTFFIVLTTGKSPGFLQWYHHATVLTFCWAAMSWDYGSGVIFAVMNYTVHSVMYSYFAVNYVVGLIGGPKSTMKKTLSVVIGPIITAMQFTQMVLGLLVTIVAAYYAFIGHHVTTPTIVQHLPQYRNEAGNLKTYACRNSSFILAAAGLMYGSYFVLFGKLALAKLDQVTKACGKKKSA